MNKAGRYLQVGPRENTRRSYRAAVEHFEVTWGGFLLATGDSIVRYLAEYQSVQSREHYLVTIDFKETAQG
jgi:hypothetical protein